MIKDNIKFGCKSCNFFPGENKEKSNNSFKIIDTMICPKCGKRLSFIFDENQEDDVTYKNGDKIIYYQEMKWNMGKCSNPAIFLKYSGKKSALIKKNGKEIIVRLKNIRLDK